VPDELLAIHGCQDPQRAGDVVFVHGLNGDAGYYWCYEGKPENYWPAWVGEDLPEVGVWSLAYENAAFKSRKLTFLRGFGYRGFAMPLPDRAKGFQLQLENGGIGKRPLVFVTHSMGGLLVKQLLRSANERSSQKSWKAILKNTRGVCFIATPHMGSEFAKWASYFRSLLGVNVSIDELKPHDSLLRQLNDSYVTLITDKVVKAKTLSFVEMKPLIGEHLIVAPDDATLRVAGGTDYPLGENHLSICKPRSKSSDIHIKLIAFIKSDCFQITDSHLFTPTRTDVSSPSPLQPPWRPPIPVPISTATSKRQRSGIKLLVSYGSTIVVVITLGIALSRLIDTRSKPPFLQVAVTQKPYITSVTGVFVTQTEANIWIEFGPTIYPSEIDFQIILGDDAMFTHVWASKSIPESEWRLAKFGFAIQIPQEEVASRQGVAKLRGQDRHGVTVIESSPVTFEISKPD
jgi:pimeloyl-ACP methyl ester carboxylesterase